MFQKIICLTILSTVLLTQTACTGAGEYFEPRQFGIRQSLWITLSPEQQQIAKEDYYREEALAIQRRQLRVQEEMLAEKKRKNDLLAHTNNRTRR